MSLKLNFNRIVNISFIMSVVMLCSNLSFSQTLDLLTLETFGAYAATGAITNEGQVTGDAGSNNGIISGSGFDPANGYTGTIYHDNATTIKATIDLLRVYIHLDDVFVDFPSTHAPAFGGGETIIPGVYSIAGAGSITGALTLDGGGDSSAVFIMKFEGAFTVSVGSSITLTGGARAANVFWISQGAISVGSSSTIKGTLFAHPGAVTLGVNSTIEGRLLTSGGAITIAAGGEAVMPVGPINIPIKCLGNCIPVPALDVLRSLKTYALFTSAGAVANAATSGIVGNIGTNLGAISGFETSTQVGNVYPPGVETARAALDLDSAYNDLINLPNTVLDHTPAFGSKETLTTGVYYTAGAGSLAGPITLDGENNPDAIFVFKFNGAFSVAAGSRVILINGASRCNVFWISEGATDMGTFTYMKGTVLAHGGACSMGANGSMEGRMLSTAGAIGFSTGVVYNDALCEGEDTPISGGDQQVCSDGTTTQTLTATATVNTTSGTIVWYDAETEGNIVDPATQVGVGSITYYAASYNGTYYSDTRTAVTLTISTAPEAPLLSSYTSTNNCPAQTADLNDITASNTPTGFTLTWHTDTPATSENKISGTSIGAGTYYGAFFDQINCNTPVSLEVVVTITPCSLPPIAMNDVAVIPLNTPVTTNVLVNDTDPQGGPMTVTETPVLQPSNGTVTLQPNGNYTYNPNIGYVGEDTFCYEVKNNLGLKDTACVTLDIMPNPDDLNNPPVAVDDNDETAQDTPVIIVVRANDNDPDLDVLGTPTPLSLPTSGTAVYNLDSTVTYTPDSGFVGTDSFKYQVCDGQSPNLCDDATVTIIVKPTPPIGNQPPVAVDDAVLMKVNIPTSGTIAANDRDPDNLLSDLTFSKITNPANGSVIQNGNGTFAYTPNSGFVGNDSYLYQVCDSSGSCDTATVSIAVIDPKIVALLPKVWLQGALYNVMGANTIMRDDLRSKGLIPLISPYPSMGLPDTTSASVLDLATPVNDAIVDWVYLELRDSTNPSTVLSTRSALLQRDGDVVEIDGISPVIFKQMSAGNYYVAVKHRNHLGVMSALPIALSTAPSVIDFRNDSTAAFNLDSSKIINEPLVKVDQGLALWAGNTLVDNRVIFQGELTDLYSAYQMILADTNNILGAPAYILKTYNTGDVDMNGETIFGNDSVFIYQNIINNHPGNILKLIFFAIKEQLP
jgi:hypothetical protein